MKLALGKAPLVSGGPSSLLLAALALSGLGLLAGPLILSLGRGRRTAGAMVEGLTLGLVPVMVLLRLLPHVAGELGVWALVLASAAFLLLRAFDRAHHKAAARVGRAFIYSALALHSFTDGVSLAAAVAVTPGRGADLTLAAAFVVHRLPEGLFIATTLLPSYGWRRTLLRTAGLFLITVVGGLAGGALLPHLSERWFDAVVALGLGAMLQLVLHSHAERPTVGITRSLASLSLLVGVAIAIAVPTPRDLLTLAQPSELPVIRSLGPLFVETAPSLLAGILLAAMARVFAAHALVSRSSTLGPLLQGSVLARSLPTGPSGVAQVARGLSRRGIDGRVISVFMVLAQGLALEGVLVSVRMLGLPIALACIVATFALGWLASGIVVSSKPPVSAMPAGHAPQRERLREVLTLALRDLDQRGAFYLFGLVVASALEAGIDPAWLSLLPQPSWLVVAALVAVPCNLPLMAAAPIVAVLLHKGLPVSAGLVVLLAGPAINIALLHLVGQTRSRRVSIGLGAALACMGLGAGVGRMVAPPPSIHALFSHSHGGVEWLIASVLAGALLIGLLRLGPGLWFAQLAPWGEVASEPHEHAHGEHESDGHAPHGHAHHTHPHLAQTENSP